MLVNSTFSGLLEAFDEDWIAVELTEGQPVEIELLGAESGMGTAADPLFALYDGEGEFLRTYYDNGESVEPRAFFTPQQSGTTTSLCLSRRAEAAATGSASPRKSLSRATRWIWRIIRQRPPRCLSTVVLWVLLTLAVTRTGSPLI